MQRPALLAVLAASLMTACSSLPGSEGYPSLESSHWQLTSVSGRTLELPASPSIELRFLDSRVHFHGCNALSGRYTQDGNTLQVPKGFVGTRMSCNDELMAIDAAATALFETGVKYQLQGDRLTLQHDTERWTFQRAPEEKN
ncbi:MAG: META domain-containing protein [Pigmentiphaga sp.]|nr:META domain-containing protein [Pigmentiphaga sp.]